MLEAYGYACVFNGRICFPVAETEPGAREVMRDIFGRAAMERGAIESADARIVRVRVTAAE